jgi:hypothetical protein
VVNTLNGNIESRCGPNLTDRTAANFAASLQKPGPRCAVNGPIHTATTLEMAVGSIDDYIDL